MEQSCLRERGKRFVQTVNHQVCAELHRGFREAWMHPEMRPMCFIDDQYYAAVVRDLRDPLHITDDAVIGGRGQKERTDIRLFLKRSFHLRRIDRIIQPGGPDSVQGGSIVGGAVAGPGHQQAAVRTGTGPDCAQDSRCASIYQEMRLAAAIERSRTLLCLLQDPLGMMQVIKAVDLRDIDQSRVAQVRCAPLMPGHMKRIGIG